MFNSYTKDKGEYLTDKYQEEEHSGKDSEKVIKQKANTDGRCLAWRFPQRKDYQRLHLVYQINKRIVLMTFPADDS